MRNQEIEIEDEFYDGEDTARRTYVRELDPQQNKAEGRRKYGNMVVLYDGKLVVTLGPDYWCFIPTFIIFCIVSFLTIRFVLTSSTNFYLQVATILVCSGMCLAYLAVATSNPGIVTDEDQPQQSEQGTTSELQPIEKTQPEKSQTKRCRRCNIVVKRTTFHCSDCDVCIRDYDHHCPWTSKCIGGGNLIRFYIFLAMVPVYIIYSFMVFGIVMSQLALEQASAKIQEYAQA